MDSLCMLVVPALPSYNAGMQYTIRNIPKKLDQAIRAKAKAEGKSINVVAVEAIAAGLGMSSNGRPKRDLSMFTSSEEDARAIEEAHAYFDRVDPEKW
jgi:plasmid stability protein